MITDMQFISILTLCSAIFAALGGYFLGLRRAIRNEEKLWAMLEHQTNEIDSAFAAKLAAELAYEQLSAKYDAFVAERTTTNTEK